MVESVGDQDFHQAATKILARAGWQRCDARGLPDPHQVDKDDMQAAGGVFLSPEKKSRFVHPLDGMRRATVYKGGVRFFIIKDGVIISDERVDVEDEEAIEAKARGEL